MVFGHMKKLAVLLLVLAVFGLSAQKTTTEGGLEITVTEQKGGDAPGYVPFLVKVKNTQKEARSLNGRVVLLTGSDEVGGCTIFLALQAGESKEKVFQCKGSGHNSWKFSVVKVYNFYQD